MVYWHNQIEKWYLVQLLESYGRTMERGGNCVVCKATISQKSKLLTYFREMLRKTSGGGGATLKFHWVHRRDKENVRKGVLFLACYALKGAHKIVI